MQIQQLSVKVPVVVADSFDQEQLIPVFHDWIRTSKLSNVLLIDVADYRHVPGGPGLMLIGHEAHYGLDGRGGRLGIEYLRKRDSIGDSAPKTKEALRAVLEACVALGEESSINDSLTFDTSQLEFRVLSRLVARNTDADFALLRPSLERVIGHVYDGASATLERAGGEKEPLTVRASVAGTHDSGVLLSRLS